MRPLEQALSAPPIAEPANPLREWQRLVAVGSHDPSRPGQVSSEFLQLVDAHFKEQHAVSPYAKLLYLCPDYLRQCCKQSLGLPPSLCIAKRLLLEASVLLSRGGGRNYWRCRRVGL